MPECVLCSAPVPRHGMICTQCDLEQAYGVVDDERVKLLREADDE